MQKSFFLLLLSAIAGTTQAQTLTADEMISKTNCKNFDCFSEFVTNKGFSFESSNIDTTGYFYLFLADIPTEDATKQVKVRNVATYIAYKDKRTGVGFTTVNKSHYQKLLDDFKQKGFAITLTSTPKPNRVWTYYRSGKYPGVSLGIITEKQKEGNKEWTVYDFTVIRYD